METNSDRRECVKSGRSIKSESRILQKRIKGNELKFQILPPKHSKQKSDGGSENNL